MLANPVYISRMLGTSLFSAFAEIAPHAAYDILHAPANQPLGFPTV